MSNIVLLFLCMVIGNRATAIGRIPENGSTAIDGCVINVSLPGAYFAAKFTASSYIQASPMRWSCRGCCLALRASSFSDVKENFCSFTPATTGGLILVAGLGNTSFVGLP